MAQFFAMGGYAAFVWPAYVLSLGVLAALAAWTLLAYRRARKALARVEAKDNPK